MSTLEVISITANVALTLSCVILLLRTRREKATAAEDRQTAWDEVNVERRAADAIRLEYQSLSQSVVEALSEVRKDIDRNYQHTHEGHLLDRLAYEFEKTRGPIWLDSFLMKEIHAAGGERFIVGNQLVFSGAISLAWHLHAQARKRAGELSIVVQESCGKTDRAAWLAKTLALYMRICGEDKEQAISSLDNVLQTWRYIDLHNAVRAAQTVQT